jgi:hypothetical protein
VQELHPPPRGDCGAEYAVREEPVLDGLPAAELVQELYEAGRLAGLHGEKPVGIGLESVLDLVRREAEATKFLEKAAQAVGVRDAMEKGGGLGGGEAGRAVEQMVQVGGDGSSRVFLGLRGFDGCRGVTEDTLDAEELAEVVR